MRLTFGAMLRERRVAARLTQEQLAEFSDISVRTIRDLERDRVRRPHRESVDLLAKALGLSDAEHDELLSRGGLAPTWRGHSRSAGDHPGVPRQLPAAVPHFTGRGAELARLADLLSEAHAGRTVVVSGVSGTGGIGKTALSLHFAHAVADQFPDGQLYVNLRGYDPSTAPMAPHAAVRAFLDALGVAGSRIPSTPDAQTALYRSLLAGKRVLIILDNARDADQVRPLLPGSPAGLVLVTSRDSLVSLAAAEGARILTLDLLTLEESRELLVRRLGAEIVRGDERIADEIIELCSRLPLALNIAAAHAAALPRQPLARLSARLRDTRTRLDVLGAGDATSDVRVVISTSYDSLDEPSARMLRLLGGVHPGPDISAAAAASLAGVTLGAARATLAKLAGAHMIAESSPGRFAFHDLLRTFALEQCARVEGEDERNEAARRMLDHYLHAARDAGELILPGTRTAVGEVEASPAVTVEEFEGYDDALDWCTAEARVMAEVVERAADWGFETHAWRIPVAFSAYFDLTGHWDDYSAMNRTALAAAERAESQRGQAFAHRRLGIVDTLRGDHHNAEDHLNLAIDLFGRVGDRSKEAASLYDLARVFELRENPYLAMKHTERAVELAQLEKDPTGMGQGLNAIAWYLVELGDPEQAIPYCEQAIELLRQSGSPANEASGIDTLGYAHHHRGDYEEAAACYLRAIALFEQAGDSFNRASTLANLGDTQLALGDPEGARATWRQAVSAFEALGSRAAKQVQGKIDALP
jgi:tetratricopeptide (TPR) repeat protein/DNA-binding XRE family transcriptional regulator